MSAVITACVWSVVDNVRAAFHNSWGTVPILFRLHHLKLLTWLFFRHKTIYQSLPTPLCTRSSISCVPEILPCCTAPEFSLWAPCIFSSYERYLHLGFLCPVTLLQAKSFKFPFGKAGKSLQDCIKLLPQALPWNPLLWKQPLFYPLFYLLCCYRRLPSSQKPRSTGPAWTGGWIRGSTGIWMTCYWRKNNTAVYP